MLNERKLTDGELKKRDEIVKAIKRDRKEENLTDEEVYAIATAQAKKTNEGIMDPYERLRKIQESMNFLPNVKDKSQKMGDQRSLTPEDRLKALKRKFGDDYGFNYDPEFKTSKRKNMRADANQIDELEQQLKNIKKRIPTQTADMRDQG